MTLVHGDFRAENIFFDEEGQVAAMVDFQVCKEGTAVGDVACAPRPLPAPPDPLPTVSAAGWTKGPDPRLPTGHYTPSTTSRHPEAYRCRYLLGGSVDTEVRRAHELQILEAHYDALTSSPGGPSRDEYRWGAGATLGLRLDMGTGVLALPHAFTWSGVWGGLVVYAVVVYLRYVFT